MPSDLWEEELAAVAASRGVPRSELEASVVSEPGPEDAPRADRPHALESNGRLAESASRLLASAAAALERSADDSELADAFGVLVLVAELFAVPRLREWTWRLAEAPDRWARSADAGRVVADAGARVHEAGNVVVLRDMEWRWPEIEAPSAPPVPAPEAIPAVPAADVLETGTREPVTDVVAGPAEAEIPEVAKIVAPEPIEAPAPEAIEEPAARARVATPSAPPAAPAPPRLRALVLDRSGIAAAFLARLLEQRGLEVVVTTDPRAAIGPQAASLYDVVFLDAELPGWSAEALLTVRPEWRERAVLLGMEMPRPRSEILGGIPYLLKPPAEEEISQALAQLASRRAARGAHGDTR